MFSGLRTASSAFNLFFFILTCTVNHSLVIIELSNKSPQVSYNLSNHQIIRLAVLDEKLCVIVKKHNFLINTFDFR